ncbi:MAG: transcription antitermination factor NusB [Lentisphaeria bacterium]|nr:transcription antitermination factor NusB [Lentisphaeria bacterium]
MSKTKDTTPIKSRDNSAPAPVFAAALDILSRWRQGAAMNSLDFPPGCRRLLTDLFAHLFRRLAVIDWMIDQRLNNRKIKPRLRDIIRLGLCSALFQDGLHEGVAVDMCVRLAKKKGGPQVGGLVNAILREALRQGLPPSGMPGLPVHVSLNLSPALHAAWSRWMSPEQLTEMCHWIDQPAPLVVRARTACPDPLPPDFHGILTPLQSPEWARDHRLWTCDAPGAFFSHPLFRQGAFYVQDPSTLLAPSFLEMKSGGVIGDFCAAPGGKTLLLAERLPAGARLLAADRSWKRMDKLTMNLSGTSAEIHLLVADAAALPLPLDSMDAALLDVPCSNTGVIRRRPDARWRFSQAGLSDIVELQKNILTGAARHVKPGGQLVYSTCSIEPDENTRQIHAFLTANPTWSLVQEQQLFPAENWDGAYAASLTRHA